MTNIEFGFSKKDSHDFKIVPKHETICNEYTHDKKIIKKYKIAQFRNEEIDCWCHIDRMVAKNAPDCLNNVEYFVAPNPFGKYGYGEKFEPYGWTFSTAILAFKCGYIDGFFTRESSIYFGRSSHKTDGIIIVDPIQRIKVREWTENEYKEFLENCNEEDFEYSVYNDRETRIGFDKRYNSVDDVKHSLIEHEKHFDKDKFFQTEHEIGAVKKYGFDKVFDAISHILLYTPDIKCFDGTRSANPLTFKTVKDAKDFVSKFAEWQEIYYCGNRKGMHIIPVNEKFDSYLEAFIKRA